MDELRYDHASVWAVFPRSIHWCQPQQLRISRSWKICCPFLYKNSFDKNINRMIEYVHDLSFPFLNIVWLVTCYFQMRPCMRVILSVGPFICNRFFLIRKNVRFRFPKSLWCRGWRGEGVTRGQREMTREGEQGRVWWMGGGGRVNAYDVPNLILAQGLPPNQVTLAIWTLMEEGWRNVKTILDHHIWSGAMHQWTGQVQVQGKLHLMLIWKS